MTELPFRAAILDLDGVLTRTARLHAKAWKETFDAFLETWSREQGDEQPPFDADREYREHVDGKPRYDGVAAFLASRGIELPRGDPDDDAGRRTVCGIGNRKNRRFRELLRDEGVEVFEDARAFVERWRGKGMATALITSSRWACRRHSTS
jgi:beta-phosphoglucomutase-like phosphatase (HAD superfamily)